MEQNETLLPPGPASDPPPPPPPQPAPRSSRRWKLGVAAAVTVGVAVALALWLTGTIFPGEESPDSPTLTGPDAAPFQIDYPRTWKPLDRAQIANLPGQPLAVLRRTDGHGTVVVTLRPPVTTPLDKLARQLKTRLAARFDDFREVGAKIATVGGGTRALVYTFARTKSGTAQSLVVVPSGNHSFTLNAVVPPRSPEAAREVGAIIASFDPQGDS